MKLKLLKLVRFFHIINKEKYNEKRQIEIVKKSPLFDRKWYLEQNPDVKAKKIGAARHYVKYGWKEGRNPSPEFDGNTYLNEFPELYAKGWCPLFHYMTLHKELMPKVTVKEIMHNLANKYFKKYKGKSNDYKLIAKSKYFNKRWYLKRYPDVKRAKVDPIEHYLKYGWKEGRNPSKKFDANVYLNRYEDVKNAKMNPLLHYEKHGKKEGRNPSADFDNNAYLEKYPELTAKDWCPVFHYIKKNAGCVIGTKYVNVPHEYEQFKSFHSFKKLEVGVYERAIILPLVNRENSGWYKGGVLDVEKKYIASSSLEPNEITFDNYKFDDVMLSDLDVIYIGGILNHYGHFICECTSRLWCILQNENLEGKLLAYTTVNNEELAQYAIDFFNLLGIQKKQLLHVKKVTSFKTVTVPDVSTVSSRWYTDDFKDIYNKVVSAVSPVYNDKIYFSRTNLAKAVNTEFGEEFIEKVFEQNGYKIVYPEQLTLVQQIALIKGCKNFACISGSLAHNMLFAQDGASIIIINKTSIVNGTQKVINEIRNLKVTYVDAFFELPYVSLGRGPFLLVPNINFYKFCCKHNFKVRVNKREVDNFIEKYIDKYKEFVRNRRLIKCLNGDELKSIVTDFRKSIVYEKSAYFVQKRVNKYDGKSKDYCLIAKSKYFDKKWYLKTYPDVKRAGIDPVKHYLKNGWIEGRNPSKNFDTEGYLKRYLDVTINPLLHYETIGKKKKYKIGSYVDELAISNYLLDCAKFPQKKKVIYSCISGGYDEIITDFYPHKDYDYILFTDNKKLLKQKHFLFWKIRPMKFTELDSVRNARWHKMHPHILFPDYEYSVWIDSNVQILGCEIYDYIDEQIIKNHNIATAIHPYRNCLYEEAQECIRQHKDNAELIRKQIDIISKEGFPKEMGLFETNIFYRKHKDKAVIELMSAWWRFINSLSRRDQLSFTYLLWKKGIECYSLGDKPLRFHPKFKLKQHNYVPSCEISNKDKGKKTKILVHLHLYYHDQLDYFIKKLKNITCDYDLYVTMVEMDEKVIDKLKQFKSSVKIIKVENRGYDIWPFICVINMINLSDYNYIIKLHTKNYRTSVWSYNGVNYIYYQWRNALVDALLKSKRIFNKNLNMLSQGYVGMIGNKDLISHKGAKDNENYRLMLCEKLGYKPENDKYIAGTMFMCASFLMKDIKNLNLSENDFDVTQNTGMVGTLAHAMESILGHTSQNYNLEIYGNKFFSMRNFIVNIKKKYINYCKSKKKNAYDVIKKSKYFDKCWYLKQYPDVKRAGIDPVKHYLKNGWIEGRNPSKNFDTEGYLNRNKDVKKANMNPLLHYEKHGKYERRKLKFENICDDSNLTKKLYSNRNLGVLERKRDIKIIVSVTSFPARINEIPYTIYSLLDQSLKPDEIVLWLGYDKFPNREKDLPEVLLNLCKRGLTIRWCKDLRSYTKLVPSLKMYPNDIIVTADDDIYYPRNWLEKLVKEHKKNPEDIICHRAHFIRRNNDGSIKKYIEWDLSTKVVRQSYYNFLTGVGGVLYPPHSLYKDVLKISLFQKLSPLADDIWFWAMAVLNGTKIRNIKDGYTKLVYINEAREMGGIEGLTLASENVLNNKNDEQLRNVFLRYPELCKKLEIKIKDE